LNGIVDELISDATVRRHLGPERTRRLLLSIRKGWEDTEEAAAILNVEKTPLEL
jgi:hypothetical protein